jgi:CSLREA domain-containing protein
MTTQLSSARGILTGALASLAFLTLAGSAGAATIAPNTFADEFNVGANCSLREAVQAANTDAAFGGCPTGGGADSIPLAAGVYQTSLPGDENANVNGSIDILSAAGVAISHVGAGATVIDGGGLDRAVGVLGGASATISGVTIRNANDAGSGGALFANGTLNLSNSTLTASTSAGGGAGFSVFGGTSTLTNVTISGNQTADDGGGVEAFIGATATLNNVTITNNTADSDASGVGDGGGFARTGANAVVNMTNTLIAGNTDRGGQTPDCYVNGAALVSQGNNLIENTTGCGFTAAGGDKLNVNPLIGPLADNGGSTFTNALLAGSPAINGAGPGAAPTDQRGVPRSSDIGAYERELCGGVVVNRVGTEGKDTLTGTAGADGILALGGKDVLKGLAGKDGLCGGNGKDTLKGGAGKDKLIGGRGADKLRGGGGKDVCKGGPGKDKLGSC